MSFEEIDLQWFAAEDEGRTEDPSEYRLRKAREEGRIPKSQELTSSIVMLAASVVLIFMSSFIFRSSEEILIYYFTRCNEQTFMQGVFFKHLLFQLLKMVVPIAGAGIFAGFLVNIAQNKGFIFTTKPIQFQFSKIIPKVGQYLKKTAFSTEGLFNIAKSLFKVVLIGFVAYIISFYRY